jgi:hypothetical protein
VDALYEQQLIDNSMSKKVKSRRAPHFRRRRVSMITLADNRKNPSIPGSTTAAMSKGLGCREEDGRAPEALGGKPLGHRKGAS